MPSKTQYFTVKRQVIILLIPATQQDEECKGEATSSDQEIAFNFWFQAKSQGFLEACLAML